MAYTKQDLINAGIPLDVTIETLYQEFKLGGLTQLPRASMSRTIRANYPSIVTLGDLFEDNAHQTRAFQEFRAGILSMKETICAVHEKWTRIVVVPEKMHSRVTLEGGLRAFLPEYLKQKRAYAEICGFQVESMKAFCRALEMLYDEKSSDNSLDMIAAVLEMTRQNVEDKINTARDEFHELFFDGKTIDGIRVNPVLIQLVKNFKNVFIVPGSIEEMEKRSGIKSRRLLELFAFILGYKILETGTVIKYKTYGHQIDLLKGRVKALLKQEGIPVPFEEFGVLLSGQFTDEELADKLTTFVMNNHEFEIIERDGKKYVAVKWKYLNNINLELLRILYDNDAWEPSKAMSKDLLKSEWERRSVLVGRKQIGYQPHYHKHWRFCATKGNYIMLNRVRETRFIPGQQYVFGLVSEHPDWSFEDILRQAEMDGYTRLYKRRSLEAYFTNTKSDNRIEKARIEVRHLLDYAEGNTMPLKALYEEVNKNESLISYAALRRWIIKNDESFRVFSRPGIKGKFVQLLK